MCLLATYRNDGEISVRDFLIALVTSLVSLQSIEHHKYDQNNDSYNSDSCARHVFEKKEVKR